MSCLFSVMGPPNPIVDVRMTIITTDEMYSDFIRSSPLIVWHGQDDLVNLNGLAIPFGKEGDAGCVPM